MARAIKTRYSSQFGATFSALLKDGSVHTEHFHVGDVINDLKYVKDEEIETVTGKLTKINCTLVSGYKTLITKSNTKFSDLYTVQSITVDCSSEFNSDVRTISIADLIGHDVNETDVKRVFATAEGIFTLSVKLSDETSTETTVHEGDLLLGVEYLPETPGDTLFGDFTIGNFIYKNLTANSYEVTGFRFINDEFPNGTIIPILAIKSCGATPTEVSTPEEFANAITAITGKGQVTMTSDIIPTATIKSAEGSDVIINLNGHSLVAPEAVNGRSLYAIDNYGNMTITGGNIEARGVENFGTMTITDSTIVARDENGGAAVWNEGDLTVGEGVVMKTLFEGATSDTSGPGCIHSSGKLTILGGTYESVNRRTYSVISAGDITVDEETEISITGAHGGLAINAGTATINGGTFVSTEYYALYVSNDGKGNGDGSPRVTVNGGDFKGKTYSVWVGSDVNNPVDCTVFIYGGIFRNPLMVQNNVAEGYGIKVYGGLFAEKINEAYVAEGYYLTDEKNADGFYEVVKGTKPVVETPDQDPEPTSDPNPVIDGDGPVDDDL